MKLLTKAQYDTLLANGQRQAALKGTDEECDFTPVVKLFYPAGAATWLLTELDPEDPDIAWGLCDLGLGCAEYGTVRLSELASFRGAFGLGIERDRHWQARAPISAYIATSYPAGRIVEIEG